jgi:hypothetical protein
MIPYSFTPYSGTEYFFRTVGEASQTRPRRKGALQIARANGSFNTFGDTAPRADAPAAINWDILCPSQAKIDAAALAFAKRGILKVLCTDGSLRQTVFTPGDLSQAFTWRSPDTVAASVAGELQPFWRSINTRTAAVSASPTIVTTYGNADVYDSLVIVFTAGGGGATGFTLTNAANAYAFTWAGTLSVGQTLTVTVGASTVVKTGAVDQISAITYGASSIGLFKLAAGANSITNSLTGSGFWTFTWRDTWY